MASLDETPILELGRQPIAGASPCGGDVTDDEQYMFVVAEISKLDRIETGEPDWYEIERQSTEILRSRCKDAEIASALGYALFKLHRYAGLAAALGLLVELVRNFWDGLYPDRPRRRKARMESLADRFTDGGWFGGENRPNADEFDGLDLCAARIDELTALLTEKMPDDPPEFGKFTRQIKEMASKRPKPQASAAEAGAAPTAGEGAAGTFAAGEVKDVSGAVNAMLKAATFIRNADRAHPLPYVVARMTKWAQVTLPPDAAAAQPPPPEATLVEGLTHQLQNGLWDHLLNNAEAAFRSNDPLWLDLQRYACAAMAGLGPTYDAARNSVIGLTGLLVRRLGSGLFDLRFKNGTPLCSGETRMWIEAEASPAGGTGGGGGGTGQGNGRLGEAAEKARKLAGSGKLKEALAELKSGLAQCTERRDRFLWRLRIAQLCFDAQRLQLAGPLLEDCYEDIRRFHIDEWEPSLAVEAAQTLYRCRKALISLEKQPEPESLRGVRESFAWLCQLDPVAALAAEPTGT